MRRNIRFALIGVMSLIVLTAGAVAWLKLHESELVFAMERSRLYLTKDLPADAARALA
jgi:hypothetical protein